MTARPHDRATASARASGVVTILLAAIATLLPLRAGQPPGPPSAAVKLLRFTGEAPSRRLGLVWRRSSAAGAFLRKLAAVLRDLPPDLLRPPGAAAKRERKT